MTLKTHGLLPPHLASDLNGISFHIFTLIQGRKCADYPQRVDASTMQTGACSIVKAHQFDSTPADHSRKMEAAVHTYALLCFQ